jgi:hypothetical protein
MIAIVEKRRRSIRGVVDAPRLSAAEEARLAQILDGKAGS